MSPGDRTITCGTVYEAEVPGAERVRALLVLSENLWNQYASDSVAVPIYEDDQTENRFKIQIYVGQLADCTRVQNFPHRVLGARLGECAAEPWLKTRLGVRTYLDILARIKMQPATVPRPNHSKWWPRQNDIHFASSTRTSGDKLFGIVSDNIWNSLEDRKYFATVRLTSKTKPERSKWEVPVSGGCVVVGDVYSTAKSRIQRTPPDASAYPTELTRKESALIAANQRRTLSLDR